MRVAIESVTGPDSILNDYEDCIGNDHGDDYRMDINHQLRISFVSDRPNLKSWANNETELN